MQKTTGELKKKGEFAKMEDVESCLKPIKMLGNTWIIAVGVRKEIHISAQVMKAGLIEIQEAAQQYLKI